MKKYRAAAALGAAILVLSACSSDQTAEAPDETLPSAPVQADNGEDILPAEGTTEAEITVDEEIRQRLDVAPGSAVIPGSIESIRVEDLSATCSAGVSDLRDLMDRFESVRQVPPDGTFESARAAGQTECSAQEWSDFYTKELAGWIYAASN